MFSETGKLYDSMRSQQTIEKVNSNPHPIPIPIKAEEQKV
jgi:hypothetical protein